MKMNKLMTGAFALTVAATSTFPALADGETPPPPVVSGVTMTQANDRKVTIEYTLADGPAVVTLDVQTNATPNAAADDPGWTSIGGEAIWNAAGDVWKKVEGDTTHTITWRPDQSWPGHKITGNGARAVVTAWATNNTPDYMVVDLEINNEYRFYPAEDFLPKASFKQEGAAITNNPSFKTDKLVMRKITAAGIEWKMGSASDETGRNTDGSETLHSVTLADNYYIGIFEVTQKQWEYVTGEMASSRASFTYQGDMRPMDNVSFSVIRGGNDNTAAPTSDSFLGKLRTKSGIPFDFPSDAQWEYAARAGHEHGCWGDGSVINITGSGNSATDSNLNKLGRYKVNRPGGTGGANNTPNSGKGESCAPSLAGTAIVGSYNPNSWGIYDMHGNVMEWCLDSWQTDISGNSTGAVVPGTSHYRYGGGWDSSAPQSRPAYRANNANTYNTVGLRLACPVGIK